MHIDPDRCQINSPAHMRIERLYLGDGRYPALIVDNFYRDPDHVREMALSLHYLPPPSKHPGCVAMLSLSTESILSFLYEYVADFYFPSLESLLRRAQPWLFYRIEPPGSRTQRFVSGMPHVDTALLAAVVYLNPPDQCRGGTALYRHVETGASALIDKDVIAGRNASANVNPSVLTKMKDLGAFQPYLRWRSEGRVSDYAEYWREVFLTPGAKDDFITDSIGGWEMTHLLEMKYNRLVLYPGFQLHSPYYRPEWFGEAPHANRLTQNFFLGWPEAGF